MTSRRFRSTLRVADAAFTGEKEVPLDATRLGMVHPRTGQKREKMGGGDGVTGNGETFPAAHLFPSPHPAAHVIPLPTPGGGRNPLLASERSRGGGIPADDRCVMQGVDTTGTPAQVRCQKPAPPGAKARQHTLTGLCDKSLPYVLL
ncbi:MAG: hypothetical protein IKZ54_03370 [Bacteroidales bacterium]|nr:hypothetical protein [Bacteroidales bacterium]